jgi:hypothetical protein
VYFVKWIGAVIEMTGGFAFAWVADVVIIENVSKFAPPVVILQ